MVQDADVILLIGNRTNANGTDTWTLLPENAKYIHIDIDPMEIGRNYESVRLLGDAKLTIKALTDALLAGDLSKRKATKDVFVKQIQEGREKHLEEIKEVTTSKIAPLRIERFMSAVEKMLPEDAVIRF